MHKRTALLPHKLPEIRNYLRPLLYGVLAGLVAVTFQLATRGLYEAIWLNAARQPLLEFLLISLLAISGSTLLAGWIVVKVSRDAAGSGIPKVKVAFWRDFGDVPWRAFLGKFVARGRHHRRWI